MIHISLRKKTSVAREHKRWNICNFSHTDFFCFLLKWTKSGKEVIYEKKKLGSPSFQESNITVMFSKRLSIHTVTNCVTFPRRPGSTAIPWCHMLLRLTWCHGVLHDTFTWCHVCLPSWSAMHDECVTCAKICAVAMGLNVLKLFFLKLKSTV